MNDLYAMNKETGELLPCEKAIHEFYKTHGALDAWTDEWEITEMIVENSFLSIPNFSKAVNI